MSFTERNQVKKSMLFIRKQNTERNQVKKSMLFIGKQNFCYK